VVGGSRLVKGKRSTGGYNKVKFGGVMGGVKGREGVCIRVSWCGRG
jgi:hypothetical protein